MQGAPRILEREDARIVLWQPLLGVPGRAAPALQASIACKALPRWLVAGRINLQACNAFSAIDVLWPAKPAVMENVTSLGSQGKLRQLFRPL